MTIIAYNAMLITLLPAPWLIIWSPTRFNAASSTPSQRAWTMTWLAMGQVFGVLAMSSYSWIRIRVDQYIAAAGMNHDTFAIIMVFYACLYTVLLSFGAVGGMVMVAKMIMEDEFCSRI
ncbi:uncharacterized protein H6S33_007082 [Morchella sextelata]|uniref:uncharacterized protein n=1 Tax=Morchella sextelata TaxID=1174677 RepID=UPI001D051032|nr:uncharacterized protein H6S33_007082 [Morchella sextelata]KAH0604051.1 hypothetical protein H6S33_007082 [Morchella sextelata]